MTERESTTEHTDDYARNNARSVLILLIAMLVLGCTPATPLPLHSEFKVGASQTEIQREFGDPARTQSIHKRGEGIWGAIETFWSSVPIDSTVEVWYYRSENPTMGAGHTELYFVDNSKTVDGRGFSKDGVVYETGGGD
ncbi:MAG: hypothetical protein OEQ39_17935 [Gammaproteobacteria bacterium]|nr:hypothetical protein [Gammaproteobacteria bacterium]MDH3467242.1 hypothetical protein [Gammaproteobacteria bacterium]